MGCETHDIVYYGALNITRGEELLKVIEAWRCRRCGATRVGSRWPGLMTSTEGLLQLIEPEEGARWLIIVTRGRGSKSPEVVVEPVKEGEGRDVNLLEESEGDSVCYFLDDVLNGYIDLTEWPPKVVTLRAQTR